MSAIGDLARDALRAAQADIAKARHTLPLAAGILALIHLLTVHPYLQAAREIAATESRIAANDAVLAGLDPELARLHATAEKAGADLQGLLGRTTEDLIARFTRLRERVARALAGEPPSALVDPRGRSPSGADVAPLEQTPQMQMPMPNLVFPAGATPAEDGRALASILAAIAEKDGDAMTRLTDFARTDLVATAYRGAQEEWDAQIRPPYLRALQGATASIADAASRASAVSADAAEKLAAAAESLAQQQAAVAALEITPDNTIDAALGRDWWLTVEGKAAFADALAQSVERRMRDIARTAQTPADALRDAQALQEALRDGLLDRQQALEEQFARHREQLATLSGTTGVIPVDLASFIGLFPLVIGIVLGVLLLRVAQARRQAALAAEGYARAAPQDAQTREWLVLGTLGGTPTGCRLAGIAVAAAAIVWIGLAGWQITDAPTVPPLPWWSSSLLGAALIVIALAWDQWSVHRLAGQLAR